MLLFLVFNCKYWRPQNIVILCFLSSNSIPLKLCTLYRVLYTLKLCQYSHSKGSGLDLFFQTVLLWAQDAFCLATSVIWTKIFHKETTSKMFPFFYSKLHGNGIHLNLLVASNRNQLELAKALKKKKKRKRERLKRIEVVSQNWWTKMQQSFQKRLKSSQETRQSFSHLCWLYFPLSAN